MTDTDTGTVAAPDDVEALKARIAELEQAAAVDPGNRIDPRSLAKLIDELVDKRLARDAGSQMPYVPPPDAYVHVLEDGRTVELPTATGTHYHDENGLVPVRTVFAKRP